MRCLYIRRLKLLTLNFHDQALLSNQKLTKSTIWNILKKTKLHFLEKCISGDNGFCQMTAGYLLSLPPPAELISVYIPIFVTALTGPTPSYTPASSLDNWDSPADYCDDPTDDHGPTTNNHGPTAHAPSPHRSASDQHC